MRPQGVLPPAPAGKCLYIDGQDLQDVDDSEEPFNPHHRLERLDLRDNQLILSIMYIDVKLLRLQQRAPVALHLQQARLHANPAGAVPVQSPAAAHHTVARDDQREGVFGHRLAGGA